MTRDDMDKKLDEALEDLAFDGWTDYAAAIRQLRIHTRAAEQEIASLRARLDAAERKLEAFEEYKTGVEAAIADHVSKVGAGVDMLVGFAALHPEALSEDAIRAAFSNVLPFHAPSKG